ncbi:PBSX family phage terminase large subunit [Lactococcus lactis]|uniref:PBSX family phage terminase large subunit n=1 Tax=Lactococcus lactis TaxID=1358 RepID=UPI001D1885DE|nr:PBSX family phage terminase large subunit [Lactococcus lactis]MCC4121357.1 PBSX family phage terminase large subunit [Lactococcus lactis]
MISFSPKQAENIKADITGIEFEMNEGTIRSGKTNSDIFKMARIYAQSPDRDHLVLAYNQEQAYRMFIDGEGFGLKYIFSANSEIKHNEDGDHLSILFPGGVEKRIFYKGGGKINAVGAITGMSFGTVTFLEFNLLNKEVIAEAFKRTYASKLRFHLGEQNPPAPNHPNLELLNQFEKTGTYRFRHWRPTDNPILTGQRLKMWEEQSKTSDYLYKRDWLGQRVMPEGVIYSMFDEDKHMTNQLKGRVIETFFTADGGQADATTCAFNVVTFHEGKHYLYRMANYYHSGTETGQTKAMSVYAKEIKQFVSWCYDKWKNLPHWEWFFVDPACKTLREELKLIGISTDKANNNGRDKVTSNGLKIEVGIERVQNAFEKGLLFLYSLDGKYDHYNLIKEIGLYIRTPNGLPVDKNNHACDELRYAVNYFTVEYLI